MVEYTLSLDSPASNLSTTGGEGHNLDAWQVSCLSLLCHDRVCLRCVCHYVDGSDDRHPAQSFISVLKRMGCRLYIMPSGRGLEHPLETPSGGVSCGKLLYGGVQRYRLLGSGGRNRAPRRAGETIEMSTSLAWLQFGGPLRVYEAIDMGPSAVIEVTLLPPQAEMPPLDKLVLAAICFPVTLAGTQAIYL